MKMKIERNSDEEKKKWLNEWFEINLWNGKIKLKYWQEDNLLQQKFL